MISFSAAKSETLPVKYQNILLLSTVASVSNYGAKIYREFRNFKSSVNLSGAYSAVLLDTDFSLTNRGFVTNGRRRLFFFDARR